jgi:uncharacterized membrane protein (UPF0127 family)
MRNHAIKGQTACAVIGVLTAVALGVYLCTDFRSINEKNAYIHAHINSHIFKTKVLRTPKELEMGMMGKKFDDNFDALLFVMDADKSSFWMKNCIVPLDVIFIKNGKISKIYHNCPPCRADPCKTYKGSGELVIEMPGGTCSALNIKRGAKVDFSL